jgi:hypothetical protein
MADELFQTSRIRCLIATTGQRIQQTAYVPNVDSAVHRETVMGKVDVRSVHACDPRIALTMNLNRSVCGTRRRSGIIGDDRRFSFFQFNGQLVTTRLVFVVIIIVVGGKRTPATALGHNDPVGGQLSQSLGQDLVRPGMEPMVLALRLQFGRSLFRSVNPSRPTRRFHSTGRVDRILHKMKPNVGEFCMRCEWSYVRASNFTNRRTPNNWNRARSDRRTPALVDKRKYGQNNTTWHKNV